MTKKDYIIIARVLSSMNTYNGAESAFKIDLFQRLSNEFIYDNPKFSEDKFKQACFK